VTADRGLELAELCRACGACCTGVMFGVVELDDGELSVALRRRLHVVPETNAFPQPCAAHDGSKCTVYDERPRGCRNYSCALYRRHAEEGGQIEQKLALVSRIRVLAELIRAEAPERSGSIFGPISDLLADRGLWSQQPARMLDIAELAMRLQRDLGWKPPPP